MKKEDFTTLALAAVFRPVAFVLLVAITSVHSAEEPVEFLADKSEFIGEPFFTVIRHEPNRWLQIDVSYDLRTWSNLVDIRSNREVFLFGDESASVARQRYYRIRSGAPGIAETRSRWDSLRPAHYKFQLRIQRWQKFDKLTATVTVEDGSKSVSNIEVDDIGGAGNPVGPDDFPEIDELFDLLAETETLNTLQSWVHYDEETGHPIECQLDFRSARQDVDHYRITNFEILAAD